MHTFYIPSIGDKIELTAPFTFQLKGEHRNETLGRQIIPNVSCGWYNSEWFLGDYSNKQIIGATIPVTFDVGTVLSVARIYVKNGQKQDDSISFNLIETPSFCKKGRVRFRMPLSDANKIQFKHFNKPTVKVPNP